jgi:hypothetical protein
MRFKNFIVLVLTLVMVLGTAMIAKAEVETSGSASTSIMSNYVWRGQKLSDDWVIQPSMDITIGDFGVNFWANYDGDTKEATETDLTLNYSFSFDKVSLGVGYIYYMLDGANDTQELYASVGYDCIVSPSLTFYYDYDEGTGGFLVLALDYSKELKEGIALSLGASASYVFDNNIVGVDKNGNEYSDFHNGEVSASLSIPVGDMVTVEPVIAYSFPLSDDAEDALKQVSFDGDEETFYGGITVGVSF